MGALSWWHWVIVLLVLVILFGSKKLPDAARGLGQSLRIFKSEVKEMQNDGKETGGTPPAEPVKRELPPGDVPPTSTHTSTDDTKKSA